MRDVSCAVAAASAAKFHDKKNGREREMPDEMK